MSNITDTLLEAEKFARANIVQLCLDLIRRDIELKSEPDSCFLKLIDILDPAFKEKSYSVARSLISTLAIKHVVETGSLN